ncbi:hypothetical protein HN51_063220 [Arachis hypogaea]
MADHIQQSSADQRKNAQLIADAIVGVNEKWKVGEKLTQLGFSDDEVVRVILKFAKSPNVYAHFWGLSDSQMIGLKIPAPLTEKQRRPDTQLRDGGDADPPARIHQQCHKPRVATGATKMNQRELERRRRGSHHRRCYRRRVRL